ncbi:hypothetical protein ACG74X_18925 [Marivita sp. S0852]|uniref:hypothetical protein n=1 Tax=Marivita sp. S0852 TaxID=3373893 RepID=UPI003982327B
MKDDTLTAILTDSRRFHSAFDTLIFNTALPGFSFFHETEPRNLLRDREKTSAFLAKVSHLAQPFLSRDPALKTHLLWSNVQPNLPTTVANVIDWADFRLTTPRYEAVKALGRQIFGGSTTFSFLTTCKDVEGPLLDHPDVISMDVSRNGDFRGDPILFDTCLQNAFDPKTT